MNPLIVWIVDDNKELCFTLSELLKQELIIGNIECFYSAESALERLEKGETIPEIILLDIELPGMKGTEAVTEFKRISPITKVIMLSNFHTDEYVLFALKRGAFGYLVKSDDPKSIIKAIESAREGIVTLDHLVAKQLTEMANFKQPEVHNYGLTPKEKEIINIAWRGSGDEAIASELELSRDTIHTHFKNIYVKLNVHSRGQMIAKIREEKLI